VTAPAAERTGSERVLRRLLTLLAWALPVVFILIPMALFLVQSVYRVEDGEIVRTITLANYVRIVAEPGFLSVLVSTLALSFGAAVITVTLGYPVALFLASLNGLAKYAATLVFVVPMVMSYIIKIYSIRALLGGNGFLNRMLIAAGVIDQPITVLIFNLWAVMLTLALILLPFTILPIFITLDRIPRGLIDASHDLGASGWSTFRWVILPLSAEGTLIGASFTFMLALGDFITPQMVGGMQGLTFGRVIYTQFGFAYNWPFGSALSVVLLAVVLATLALTALLARRWRTP
jgi:spermidine/putrescine transport system permease protein